MKWISDLIDLLFPRHCIVCGEILSRQEQDMCLDCLYKLPKIEQMHLDEIEKVFWGKCDIAAATSYIYYRKGSPYNRLIHRLKYGNRPETGVRLARMAAESLKERGFFDGIDAIVPLPLSKKKQRRRGYNQCDYIAEGLSAVSGIPVIKDSVTRKKANETQTHKSRDERWKNVEGIFELTRPELIDGKHILLIDDILTTGATLTSCAATIQQGCNCRISIFTLAYTYNGI
ncbi:MAG: ComF family protein [Bacteroidaceae bacterium]|nr:ComF family protein [Bacteroidaceae bacterium]